MASLAQLEEQLSRLQALNKASARAVDAFADTAHAIATRARAITRDVRPWQIASENVARTMEEAARAARCYHPPPYLARVLTRHDHDVTHVVRCLDYLVYTDNYLATHMTGSDGDGDGEAEDGGGAVVTTRQQREAMALRTHTQLTTMVHIAEELVRNAFIAALQRTTTNNNSNNNNNKNDSTGAAVVSKEADDDATAALVPGRVVRHPQALRGVAAVVRRLGENFNRTHVVQHDVRRLLEERLRAAVLAQFDGTYRDEEEYGMARHRHSNNIDNTTTTTTMMTSTSMPPASSLTSSSSPAATLSRSAAAATASGAAVPTLRHYQRGEHRLLGISRATRAMVREVAACVHATIIAPLDDDYAVTELAGELAGVAFDLIAARARRAIAFDVRALHDPARLLVELRGQDASLCPAPRCLRDVVFVGCDVVRELYEWKTLASAQLPGDARACIEHVDDVVDDYLARLRDVLEAYVNAKGVLDAPRLRTYTSVLHRSEWLAASDGSPHEMTTNVLYFQKVLLTSYYGALKLVLRGSAAAGGAAGATSVTFGESDDDAAVAEVEDWLVRSVLGTVQDLHTIAQVTLELQEEQQQYDDKHTHAQQYGHADDTARRRHKHDTSQQQQQQHGQLLSASSVSPLSLTRQLLRGDVRLRDGMVQRMTGAPTRLSREVFVLNNVLLLENSYRREACFVARRMRVEADNAPADLAVAVAAAVASAAATTATTTKTRQQRRRHEAAVVELPLVTHALTALAAERERCIVDYGASWQRCFPPLDIASISSSNNNSSSATTTTMTTTTLTTTTAAATSLPPLRSSERMAVKRWHRHVTRALRARIHDGKSQVVLDAAVRTRLIDAAVAVVSDAFAYANTVVLRNRAWSRHPRKWAPYDVDEWVAQLRTLF